MTGRRLLDIAVLFNASRGVAQKHVALRSQQFDVYNKTSSLSRAVRNQTDRITETAKAASFLASRLTESAPAWASDAVESTVRSAKNDAAPISSIRSTSMKETAAHSGKGQNQDHTSEESLSNSTQDVVSKEELEVRQEKAGRYPLPDGTIPPTNSSINRVERDRDLVSDISKDSMKKPLAESAKNDLEPTSLNTSTIPTPSQGSKSLSSDRARELQKKSEHQIPSNTADALGSSQLVDGQNSDIFYTPSGHTSPALSSLPRAKIPRHTENSQGGDGSLKDPQINSDTFYSSSGNETSTQIPKVEAVPEQEQMPPGINTDVFYSPRVAKLLGGKTHLEKKVGLQMKAAAKTPIDNTSLAENRDQDSFNVHSSNQTFSSTLNDTDSGSLMNEKTQDVADLAEDIAKDRGTKSSSTIDVSYATTQLVSLQS